MSFRSYLRAGVLAALSLSSSVGATWSILIVDTRTGEIAVGSATCVTGLNLRAVTPVLLVGRGAATAQASVNPNSITNRALIWSLLQQGAEPAVILNALEVQDPGHQARQYGIIDVTGGKVTFSGTFNSAWAGGVTGSIGTIHYAVQGNILTGEPVVTAAVNAIRNTPGDLAEKLMAGMEAAFALGGDGRCSCGPQATSCGSPPPSFTKTAHIGYMLAARQGDTDGTCVNTNLGCASGSYYLELNVAGQSQNDPDPVLQLRTLFDAWRTSWTGRPDHNLSTVSLDPPFLVPDGASSTEVTVQLVDWQGNALTSGGATVGVSLDASSTATVGLSSVTDLGDGRYRFTATAGTGVGSAQLRIEVDDGGGAVLLSPRTEVPVRNDALWADTARMSAATGGTVNLALAAGSQALDTYLVAATGSGTMPGIPFPGALIPLNADPWFNISALFANSTFFVNTFGTLDIAGRANAQFTMPGAGFLSPIIGADLHLAFFTLAPIDFASNPVRVTITP